MKPLSPGAIAGIVVACVVVVAGIVTALVLTLKPKQPRQGPAAANPGPGAPVTPVSPGNGNGPSASPSAACLQTAFTDGAKVKIWLPTFTAITGTTPNAAKYYTTMAKFAAAFNQAFASKGVQIVGMWVNLADGSEDLTAFSEAVCIAKANGIALGAVMAVGGDPTAPYFKENFDNFNKLNAMYDSAFTQMAFDAEDILPSSGTQKQNGAGIAWWLSQYSNLIPDTVNLVAFSGSLHVNTPNILANIDPTHTPPVNPYRFQIAGMVEDYSTGSPNCMPYQSGCSSPPVSVQDVLANWLPPTGACFGDRNYLNLNQSLFQQQGTWAGLSLEGQNCTGGCLNSLTVASSSRRCDAGGTNSFAQFSPSEFVQILTGFAAAANATPSNPLNIMLYESAFLPGPWLDALNVPIPS